MDQEFSTAVTVNQADQEYNRVASAVLAQGTLRGNRTNKRAVSTFGNYMDLDISDNIGLISTKRLPLRYIVGELLWFIAGSSDIGLLNEISGVPAGRNGIWDEWALSKNYYQENIRSVSEMVTEVAFKTGRRETVINQELVIYQEKYGLDGITKYMAENGVDNRAKTQVGHKGYIGPLYGHQWRRRQTEAYIDQLGNLLDKLNNDPLDRRHLLVAWDPDSLPRADLSMDENILINKQPIAPCHWASQYYAEPVLTSSTVPLVKFKADESGSTNVKVNQSYLGETFKIVANNDGESEEFVFTTADYLVQVTELEGRRNVTYTDKSVKDGIKISDNIITFENLLADVEYEIYVEDGFPVTMVGGSTSGMLHMRSSDVFLGLPFNIPSYALLIHLISRELGAKPKRLFVTLGDYHIYENHLEQIKTQLGRESLPPANFKLSDEVPPIREIMDMANSPIRLKAAVDAIVACVEGYESHSALKGEVAV